MTNKNLLKHAIRLVTVLSPGILLLLLVHFVFGWNIFGYAPLAYNDEIGYWHQILTFSEVGFDGGYYSPNEKVAPLAFIHFDAHGPMFPVIYGAIAVFTGWNLYSHVLINITLVAIALWIFTRNLEIPQLLLTGLTVVTFWPVVLYLGTAFEESLHDVAAIIFAALFSNLIKGELTKTGVFILFVLIFIFGLTRYSWGVLLLPLGWYLLATRTLPIRLAGVSFAGLLVLLLIALFSLLAPPESDRILMDLHAGSSGVGATFLEVSSKLAVNFRGNIKFLLSGYLPIGSLMIIETALVLGLLLLTLMLPSWRKNHARSANQGVVFHLFNLVPITMALLVFNSTFGRVVSAHVLLSLLVMVRLGPRWIVGSLIAINLAATPLLIQEFEEWWGENYRDGHEFITHARSEISTTLRYQENPDNPWCNTILISLDEYDERILAIPAGIGVSYTDPQIGSIEPFPRSKYVLGEKLVSSWGKPNFKLLKSTSIGNIYLNRRSSCKSVLP